MKTLADWVEINPKTTLTKGKTYPFVGMEAITPHQRYVNTSEQRTFSGNGSKFQHLDTLFARITPCLENGKISQFIQKEKSIAFGSTEFFVFRAIPGKSTPSYVYYLTQTKEIQETAIKSMVGASGRQRADAKAIRSIPTELPKVEEQEKISAVLSNYDDLIATNQRRIALMEEAAHLIYREWFIHMRFPGHESTHINTGIPGGWKSGSAHEFINILSGGTPKTSINSYWGGDIPFFTPKDSPNCFYTTDTEKSLTPEGLNNCNSRLFPKETIFITARGTVGKTALSGRPMAMNQSCYALTPKEGIGNLFLFMAIRENISRLQKAANGGVFNAIVVDTFKHIPFLTPKSELTLAFDDKVRPLFEQALTLIQQNKILAQARDLLLPKLMSGQIDVSNIQLPDEDVVT
jgi:hypothetical protein